MPAFQCSAWCWTVYPPDNRQKFTQEELDTFNAKDWEDIRYLIYQLEVCPDTKRWHIQGYTVYTKKKTLSWLKQNCHATAHFESRKGTHEQARDYCKKEDSVHPMKLRLEMGDEPKPGLRKDLLAVKETIDSGVTMSVLWDTHFPEMVKYNRSLKAYRNLKTPPRNHRTEVAVFYGPTGTGKTRHLLLKLPHEKTFFLNRARTQGDPWLDYYDPMEHEHIVLDDFYGWIKWDTLLRMCDHAPMLMETKGDQVQFRPKYIWITSNKPPSTWYKETPYRLYETLERRIDVIAEFWKLDEDPIMHKQPDE